ncbi:hypothetical protein LIER_29870 [Lithospermum erythrorhizon]|uniref:Retrovirus-related Pol polyprotein from transposon TNT 1-94 n=1 Tax=Lithospermum erythrorhizon TaxID=34254 RepID=A0AAV3RKP1_LITER
MCAFNSKVGKNMRSKTLTVLLYLSLFLISNPSLWNVGISSFSVVADRIRYNKLVLELGTRSAKKMSGEGIKIKRFTGRNSFSLWQIKVRALLKREGLWAPLMKNPPALLPNNMARLEEKAHSTLILALDYEVITEVSEEDTVAGLWLKLESLYMTKSLTNKLLLKERLFGLRIQEDTSLKNHLDHLNSILLDLHNIDIKIEDEDAALILLASLPMSYENFRESMTNDKDSLSLEEMRFAIHNRDLHISCSSGSSTTVGPFGALVANTSGDRPVERFSSRPGRGSRKTDRCNFCRELGYWKRDCPKLRNEQRGASSGTAAIANGGMYFEEDMALIDESHTSDTDVWFLDL